MATARKSSQITSPQTLIYPDFVALKASGTLRKIMEADGVSYVTRTWNTGWIAFRQLSKYKDHHAADETLNTGKGNASLKAADAYPAFDALRPGNPAHPFFAETLARQRLIASPKAFDEQRLIFLTDDATLALPKDALVATREALRPFVEEKYLESVPQKFDGKSFEVLPHVSQLFCAVGVGAFVDALRQGALEAGYNNTKRPLIVYSQTDYAVTRMSAPPGAALHFMSAANPMYLFAPDGLDKPLRASQHPIAQLEDFFRITPDADRPITDAYDHYMSQRSSRRELIPKLLDWAVSGMKKTAVVYDFRTAKTAKKNKRHTALPGKASLRQNLRLVQPIDTDFDIGDTPVTKMGGIRIVNGSFLTKQPEDYFRAHASEYDFGKKSPDGRRLFECPDITVLSPIDPKNDRIRIQAMARSFDVRVSSALDARAGSIICLNLNGCYDDMLADHHANANFGFSKAFARRPFHDQRIEAGKIVNVPDVVHTADCHMDVLSGGDLRSLVKAAKQVIAVRLKSYVRLEPPGQFEAQVEQMQHGRLLPEYTVTCLPIASAASTLRPLNTDARAYTRFLAKEGLAMVWGGGDQYTMGALYDGYREAKGVWSGALSTHRIITEEARTGRIPDGVSYWQLSRGIDQRLKGLFLGLTDQQSGQRVFNGANFVQCFDGGDGTGQEAAFFLNLKLAMPKLVEGRFMSFYMPAYSRQETTIRALLGDENLQKLKRDHTSLIDHFGVMLATDLPELKRQTREVAGLTKQSWRDAAQRNAPMAG